MPGWPGACGQVDGGVALGQEQRQPARLWRPLHPLVRMEVGRAGVCVFACASSLFFFQVPFSESARPACPTSVCV